MNEKHTYQDTKSLLMTREELIQALRIGKTTLYEIRKAGLIREVKFGRAVRFNREDVKRLACDGWRQDR